MAEARASHLRLVVSEPAPVAARLPRLRFKPIVRMEDGAAFGAHVEAEFQFEDTFRPRHLSDAEHPSAASWLGDIIERVGRMARESDNRLRPISITAPMAVLADRDAPMAAEAGVRRGGLLPQEIRIDFVDASVSALEDLAMDRLDAFRKRGFRVGLDARRSWHTPMNARARQTFEAVRLEPNHRDALDIPLSRIEAAAADGVALIAENVHWREAETLADLGVHFAMTPRADS